LPARRIEQSEHGVQRRVKPARIDFGDHPLAGLAAAEVERPRLRQRADVGLPRTLLSRAKAAAKTI
jgi:hypothetical protein